MKDKLTLLISLALITAIYFGAEHFRPVHLVDWGGIHRAHAGVIVMSGGLEYKAHLTGNTTSQSFGTVTATNTTAYVFTFTNNGNTTAYPSTATVSGTNYTEFPFKTWDCGTILTVNYTCQATYSFVPNTTTGAKSATAIISYTW